MAKADPAPIDLWGSVETPAAFAVSDATTGAFRPGIMPAVGLYAARDRIAIGVRGRAGVLRDGPPPGNNVRDPGLGGVGTIGIAIRAGLATHGGWVEAVGGAGITGHDRVPMLELGAGWTFAVGGVDVGPSVRYVKIVSPDPMATFGTAELALVGIDVRFGRDGTPRREPRVRFAAVEPVAPPVEEPVVVAVVDDGDRATDRDAGCVADPDGCPLEIAPAIVVMNDRIVLDERVMFDLDKSRVRSAGREAIAAIGVGWAKHPEWARIIVEGHADVRGDDAYNLWLSQQRAEHCRAVLIKRGFDPVKIDAVGYGRSRPRATGTDEISHRRNRRVEFAIVRDGGAK